MINRISEIPFWGPEEQIRKFINQHDENFTSPDTQQTITQQRIENLDDIFQKQLIWSYGRESTVDDAYFYWDWCPVGEGDSKWQIVAWGEYPDNLARNIDRTFDYRKFKGYRLVDDDEMPQEYDAESDEHALQEKNVSDDNTTLDVNALRHNIMRSYLEVSEWLGDAATNYGSHNGYVSRKMSLAWLFDAIRALINWKMKNQTGYGEVDITPLQGLERFLPNNTYSTQGVDYKDDDDLDQKGGHCATQSKVRAKNPNKDGILRVCGNEWHYGERAWFYTHNSFIGECRFFHNARFLGQTTFDKEINGTTLRSRWSDVCEYYIADKKYEPGTLVMFGGDNEVTISDGYTVNGIVTTKPGFILNGDATKSNELSVGIALVGRVPVNVVGNVRKFDKLVASKKFPGYARRKRWYDLFKHPIGVALSDSKGGQVECATKLNF